MRFLLRMLGLGVTASAIAIACGGSEFSSEDHVNAGSGAGAKAGAGGTAGSSDAGTSADVAGASGASSPGSGGSGAVSSTGGTAGGGTTLCSDAKDCDDGNPCTLDTCGENGICENPPKCGGEEPACCDGVCSHCCSASDCDDAIDCTSDTCFAGVCNHLPGTCGTNEYCSTDPADGPSGCLPQESCNADGDCDDQNPCTTDSCVSHKCTHPSCPDGGSCCPGRGCGSCCADSQCPSSDPCNPSTCGTDLKCAASALCGAKDLCCPSADKKTAACGECCAATDCPDDGVSCTDAKCKADPSGFLTCSNVANADHCPTGQTCDPETDCTAGQCKAAGDCPAPNVCKQVACTAGTCVQSDLTCSHGQHCCAKTSGNCQDCCDNTECKSSGMNRCCSDGTCAQCCVDSDCALAMPVGGAAARAAPVGAVGGGDTPCTIPRCDAGVCMNETQTCGGLQKCCPGVGCATLLSGACPVSL